MPFTRRQSRLAAKNSPAPQSRNDAQPASCQKGAHSVAESASFLEDDEKSKVSLDDPIATPKSTRGPLAFLSSITHRAPKTPKDKTPLKLEDAEMHPHRHQKTTATPYDEARWLGFFSMGPQTEPKKTAAPLVSVAETSPTPKTAHAKSIKDLPSPAFQFSFSRQPSLGLSEEAQRLMAESRDEAAKIRARLVASAANPNADTGMQFESAVSRKIAKPKGRIGRFSDVHLEQFKNMDSIANHPSAWRTDPNRFKTTTTTSLKRSPSKAELDKHTGTSLKHSPSKADLDKPENKIFLSKIPGGNGIERSQNAMPTTPAAKRIKHDKADDAATTRPTSPTVTSQTARKNSTLVRSKSGLLRPGFSHLMTPTKASLARTQSFSNLQENTTMITPIIPSKLTKDPSRSEVSQRHTINSSINLSSPSPAKIDKVTLASPNKQSTIPPPTAEPQAPLRVKSILRTPHRRYTKDPTKIAAGTHLATPPDRSLPMVSFTAPVTKHVDFTSSTKEKVDRDADKAASVEPELVKYPKLFVDDSPRGTTLSSIQMPGAFTFRSDKNISFGPATTGTIRKVHSDDIGISWTSPTPGLLSKRKLNPVEENSGAEKENCDAGEEPPLKRLRKEEKPELQMPRMQAKKTRLPTYKGIRSSGLTAARLSLLARPKRRA